MKNYTLQELRVENIVLLKQIKWTQERLKKMNEALESIEKAIKFLEGGKQMKPEREMIITHIDEYKLDPEHHKRYMTKVRLETDKPEQLLINELALSYIEDFLLSYKRHRFPYFSLTLKGEDKILMLKKCEIKQDYIKVYNETEGEITMTEKGETDADL